jgi:hypothetical protein
MSIDEMKEKKRQLEDRISKLVTEFTAETGVGVFGVSTERRCVCDACGQVIATEYRVTAEVML